jgi:hypothetical protein
MFVRDSWQDSVREKVNERAEEESFSILADLMHTARCTSVPTNRPVFFEFPGHHAAMLSILIV